MKTRTQCLSLLAILAVALGMVSWSSTLHAQTTTPSTSTEQQPMPQQQASPDNTPTDQTQQPSAQAPEVPPATQQPPTAKAPDQAQSSDSDSSTPAAAGLQVFTGTVVKSGDKYVLKDDSGQTYNIDHQDEVAKFEGKHIRVHGTLDEKGAIQVK